MPQVTIAHVEELQRVAASDGLGLFLRDQLGGFSASQLARVLPRLEEGPAGLVGGESSGRIEGLLVDLGRGESGAFAGDMREDR